MKAIIEYDIGGDDKEDFELMVQSRDMHLAAWKFLEHDDLKIRLTAKYKNKDICISDLVGEVKECFRYIMDDLNVNLDVLS